MVITRADRHIPFFRTFYTNKIPMDMIYRDLLTFLFQLCYIWTQKNCGCEMREQMIIFKCRYGKKFDSRLAHIAGMFGFQTITSHNTFDYVVMAHNSEILDIVNDFLANNVDKNRDHY